jgi:hypothetical protein
MAVPASPVDDAVREAPWSHPEQLVAESCTISRWRGYVSSAFIALREDGTPVAESAEFRWRGKVAPPDEGPARKASDELRAELDRLGWKHADTRQEVWYAARFTRVVAVQGASAAPAPPVLEAPPVVEPQRRPLYEAPAPPPAPPRVEAPVEPEPRPVEAAAVVPPAAQTAVEAPRRSRAVTVVSVLGIVVALAVAAYLAFGQGSRHARAQAAPVSTAKPKHAAQAPADPAAAASVSAQPLARPSVRVAISASGRSSWLEVRRGSATGPVLFTGELAPGRTLHLAGRRLWGRFGAAGNLTITANGRSVRLLGTYEHVFTSAKP